MEITRDENGQLLLGGERVLLTYMRGEYVRRKKKGNNYYTYDYYGGRTGLVMAFFHDGKILYGYSKVNLNAGDKFDREKAILIAVNRMLVNPVEHPFPGVRYDVFQYLHRLSARAKKYYATRILLSDPWYTKVIKYFFPRKLNRDVQ